MPLKTAEDFALLSTEQLRLIVKTCPDSMQWDDYRLAVSELRARDCRAVRNIFASLSAQFQG